MENASKALIIAGAILLSILIIALGIFVFNAAKGAVNTDQLDATEKQTFNGQFESYEGKQMGTNVKTLISAVITNVGSYADDDARLPDIEYKAGSKAVTIGNTNVKVNGVYNVKSTTTSTGTTNMSNLRSVISNTHEYTVTFAYSSTGLVNKITIAY